VSGGPSTTVVIPTHNRRALLRRALDSVLRQGDTAVEVVVVDDGGTDGTAEAVHALGRDDVRLLRHGRSKGVSAARNAGLAVARTPWVAFLDDDDLWAPDKVRAQLAGMAEYGGSRWSCVGAVYVDSDLHVRRHAHPPASGSIVDLLCSRQPLPGGGSGALVDTELARKVGGYDEQISITADWDFYLRLSLRSPIAAVDRPLMAYYGHPDSMYHNPEGLLRELLYLDRKHADLPGGGSFAVDQADWTVRAAGMARRLGDHRTSWRVLGSGLRRHGVAPIGRKLVGRVGRRFRPPDEPAVPFPEPVSDWLDRYAHWPS
jgi:glycosyltransferase involved in cell wall biosynthesis